MKLYNEETITEAEKRTRKLELISKILNYPNNKNLSVEKQVATFDKLYDLPLEELTIYYKVYK